MLVIVSLLRQSNLKGNQQLDSSSMAPAVLQANLIA